MAVLTRRPYGRVGVLILGVVLLVALLAFAPSTDAADGTTGITIETDAGVILLSTGPEVGDNWIRYYENPSPGFDVESPDHEQFIHVDKCEVTTPTGNPGEASLLTVAQSPSSKGLGLVSNGFGVRTKNNCATSNGQIDTTQSLTFSLAVGDVFDESHAIDRIEVDVEGKQNAQLSYTLNNDAGAGTKTINPASDNGADAGIGDNVVVVITGDPIPGDETAEDSTKLFTSATFFPSPDNDKALVSIEGGGDGAAPLETGESRLYPGVTQTLFHIVSSQTFDGEIRCEDPSVPPTMTDPDGPAPALTSSELTRALNTKEDDGECDLIPYTFQIEEESVYVDFLDTEDDGARFLVKIEWDPNDVTVNPLDPPVREVDYFDDGVDDYYPGVACVSTTATDPVTPSIDYIYGHPRSTVGDPIDPIDPGVEPQGAEVPVCLAGEQLLLTPDGWQQIQWWDIKGDPRFK